MCVLYLLFDILQPIIVKYVLRGHVYGVIKLGYISFPSSLATFFFKLQYVAQPVTLECLSSRGTPASLTITIVLTVFTKNNKFSSRI